MVLVLRVQRGHVLCYSIFYSSFFLHPSFGNSYPHLRANSYLLCSNAHLLVPMHLFFQCPFLCSMHPCVPFNLHARLHLPKFNSTPPFLPPTHFIFIKLFWCPKSLFLLVFPFYRCAQIASQSTKVDWHENARPSR